MKAWKYTIETQLEHEDVCIIGSFFGIAWKTPKVTSNPIHNKSKSVSGVSQWMTSFNTLATGDRKKTGKNAARKNIKEDISIARFFHLICARTRESFN